MFSSFHFLELAAKGRAMVALSANDFGNFITHPLMQPPSPPRIQGAEEAKLEFLNENVQLDPTMGSVTFYGIYAGATWEFVLKRANSETNKAVITATLVECNKNESDNLNYVELAEALTETTSRFFNEMVFELDGTFLSFQDMMLTDKGKEPSVMLSLAITVRKFPSPGLQF
jgi:hypothetical protein